LRLRLVFNGGLLSLELKIFTLPTCSVCSLAKTVALDVAEKYGVSCRIVDMSTKEGLSESLAYQLMSAPSIVIDDDVVVRGHIISEERLKEEVQLRLKKWAARSSSE